MKISHLADIHTRFGTRSAESKLIMQRFCDDLKQTKSDRCVIVGDIVHNKINMSPNSTSLTAEFLFRISQICPVDIVLGNHDLNLQQLEQGDAISPIFKLTELTEKNKERKTVYTVNEQNKKIIDFWQNAIYFYPDSGLYDLGNSLIYGVFSCRDNEVVKIDKKEKGKTYVALYHGCIFGAKGDNGYELKGGDLIKLSTFDTWDILMLGDIHERQSFDRYEEKEVAEEEFEKKYKKEGWEISKKSGR